VNRVIIVWRGEDPDELPRRGRDNGPIRPYTPEGVGACSQGAGRG
jgi:hypothetical protein